MSVDVEGVKAGIQRLTSCDAAGEFDPVIEPESRDLAIERSTGATADEHEASTRKLGRKRCKRRKQNAVPLQWNVAIADHPDAQYIASRHDVTAVVRRRVDERNIRGGSDVAA